MATVNLLERRDVPSLLPVSAPEMLSAPESPESVLGSLEPAAGDPGSLPTLATPPSDGLGSAGLGNGSSVGEAGSEREGTGKSAEDECSTGDDDDGSACDSDVAGLADECFSEEEVCVGVAVISFFVVEVVW